MDFDEVRRMGMRLPGAQEGTSYGTPALLVRGKAFARLREDGGTVVLKRDVFERAYLMEAHPEVFYVTDHYRGHPAVLVRLSAVSAALMREALEESWRRVASRKQIAELDRVRADPT
jgi:hypothetical protein